MKNHRAVFEETLVFALTRWGLAITAEQLRRMWAHFEAVVETNRMMNLTRITEPSEAAVKHYADSLSLLAWTQERSIAVRTVLDVGTGAGFPAVPLAVMRPDWDITTIDATRKKVEFLTGAAAVIGATNLHVEHAHAAHWQTDRRFDLVATRALGPLGRCLELCSAFVRTDGRLVVYKTASLTRDEMAESEKRVKTSRMLAEDPFAYDLQVADETLWRKLHLFRRTK